MKMKVNNLDKWIKDYESIFDTVVHDCRIYSLLDDIRNHISNHGVGYNFCIKQKKYYKNGIGSLDSKMISFNFALTEKTDDQEVITYLGYL